MSARASLLWLRLSLRDLRQRWVLVVAIAALIALGTGTSAGLGSTAAWRRQSNDESFAHLRMHDLRITLAQGASAAEGSLRATIRGIAHADAIAGIEERLIGATQVDVVGADGSVLVPGQLVGVDVAEPLEVDALHASAGRSLDASDEDRFTALLESQFAEYYELADSGALTVSGGHVIEYVGLGTSPEYFLVSSRTAIVFAHTTLAVLFVPLRAAQTLLDRPDRVNEAVITLSPGADRSAVEQEILAALDSNDLDASITVREDEPAWRMLYRDIESDQEFWNVVAVLILLGATFAAFSLVSRIVESQRREIGIGMALGVSPRRLAIRPLLVGVEIAVVGVAGGILVGLGLDELLASVFRNVLPLPIFRTPFQADVFARSALLGLLLPLAASAIPVWRAVRVQPVDAIRTGHLATRGGRARLSWLRLPGRSVRQMPLRNLSRAPRRTLMTAVAIAASITTLIAILGMVDSFVRTIDGADAESRRGALDRMQVELDTFHLVDAPEVAAIASAPQVARADIGLRLFGVVGDGDGEFDVIADLIDFQRARWVPTLVEGTTDAVLDGGIVLSRKAADDLGVGIGDTVAFSHPVRSGLSYRVIDDRVTVGGIHPGPTRNAAFFDIGSAELFNMAGVTNLIDIAPAAGLTENDVQRALFRLPGVGSVQSVSATTRLFRDALDDYFGILRVVEVVVLILAVLIAFNSASIGTDERARENATMLAFGVRPRTVLGIAVVEMTVIGIAGTALGLIAGRLVLRWMTTTQLAETAPDIGVVPYTSPGTLAVAVVLGVVGAGVAPLLTSRRIRRLDIPATLRVVE
jgi:putative ABC transport system permease protein